MLTDSTRRHLKVLANLLFIGIALALFILNIVRYVRVYLTRPTYQLDDGTWIVPIGSNSSLSVANCSLDPYAPSDANHIYQWFIQTGTVQNRLFHAFFWWMMIFSAIVSIVPSLFYIVRYFRSNQYNIRERFWLAKVNHFIRTFFSTTIFILPSFYMYTFEFDEESCLRTYPMTLAIDLLPFVFVTMISLILYFLAYVILHQFYAKHRFCCTNECLSYGGLCCFGFVMIGIILFSMTIIFYVWISSFIEKPLRLAAILLVVQVPFLPLQLFID